ncbi:MAG: hypothetical protein HRT88_22960, partial [Lentisphaeraceae bacterium]|nr:hypothetical protein [Lentisphaeraceae bacterium]
MRFKQILFLLFVMHLGVYAQTDAKFYQKKIRPLLEKYCQGCHGPKKAKSKIRVDVLDHQFQGKGLFVWEKMLHVLET